MAPTSSNLVGDDIGEGIAEGDAVSKKRERTSESLKFVASLSAVLLSSLPSKSPPLHPQILMTMRSILQAEGNSTEHSLDLDKGVLLSFARLSVNFEPSKVLASQSRRSKWVQVEESVEVCTEM